MNKYKSTMKVISKNPPPLNKNQSMLSDFLEDKDIIKLLT